MKHILTLNCKYKGAVKVDMRYVSKLWVGSTGLTVIPVGNGSTLYVKETLQEISNLASM